MLLPHRVYNALVAGGRLLGVEQQAVSGVREVVRPSPRTHSLLYSLELLMMGI